MLGADKAYEFTIVFGVGTDSGDREGAVTSTDDVSHLRRMAVAEALAEFRGDIDQIPPMYSALKRDGVPLYKLARRGVEVEREPRRVRVDRFELLDFRPGARAEADCVVDCAKGVYIRSLAMDLGRSLGCGAHLSRLRRTRCGACDIQEALTMERLETLAAAGDFAVLDRLLLPPSLAMAHLPTVNLPEALERRWRPRAVGAGDGGARAGARSPRRRPLCRRGRGARRSAAETAASVEGARCAIMERSFTSLTI